MIKKIRTYRALPKLAHRLKLLDVLADAYGRRFHKQRKRTQGNVGQPRFLLMTSGHLGDALTLSYLFPLIRQQFPTCVIDVVAGAWCDPILAGNPYIRRLIHLNHSRSNRSADTKLAKWKDYFLTTWKAIARLTTETYTTSVDIRFVDSTMHFLLPFIQVNWAVGYGSRGLGGLLDKELTLPDEEFHHLTAILNLLGAIGVEADLRDVRPYFDFPAKARQTLLTKLPLLLNNSRPIVLLCPESGSNSRFLPDTFWREMAGHLLATTDSVLIGCGQMPQTTRLLADIAQDNPTTHGRIHNTVGQLSLSELAALSEHASVALTLESLPAHLCAVFCPVISFFYEGTGLQFFPLSTYPVLVFHNHLPSRDLTLDRPGFVSSYVGQFDGTVIEQAVQAVQVIQAATVNKVW